MRNTTKDRAAIEGRHAQNEPAGAHKHSLRSEARPVSIFPYLPRDRHPHGVQDMVPLFASPFRALANPRSGDTKLTSTAGLSRECRLRLASVSLASRKRHLETENDEELLSCECR